MCRVIFFKLFTIIMSLRWIVPTNKGPCDGVGLISLANVTFGVCPALVIGLMAGSMMTQLMTAPGALRLLMTRVVADIYRHNDVPIVQVTVGDCGAKLTKHVKVDIWPPALTDIGLMSGSISTLVVIVCPGVLLLLMMTWQLFGWIFWWAFNWE